MIYNIMISLISIGIILFLIKKRTDKQNNESNREEVREEENHRPIDISDETIVELAQMIKTGEKIQAIKKLKEETGISLVEAKNYIDKLDGVL